MTSSIPTSVLLILAGVVGILLGLLLSALFRSEPKSTSETNPLPQKYIADGYAEAARLYYSPAAKKMLPYLDGDVYPDFSTLTIEQKKRVIRLIQSWNEWGGVEVSTMTVAASSSNRASEVSTSRPNPIETRPEPAQAVSSIPPLPVNKISSALKDTGQEKSEPAAKVEKPKTIVEQIDDILREMEAAKGEFTHRVHLTDDGHQGVIVWVGAEKFNGVDQVPYPDVQQIIRDAVASWEATAVDTGKAE